MAQTLGEHKMQSAVRECSKVRFGSQSSNFLYLVSSFCFFFLFVLVFAKEEEVGEDHGVPTPASEEDSEQAKKKRRVDIRSQHRDV